MATRIIGAFAAYLHTAALVVLVFLLAGIFIGVEATFPLLLFCTANLLVLLPILAIRKRFFPSCDIADGFLVCATLYLALLVFGLTALGFLGLLSLRIAFICSCAFFLITAPLLPVPSGLDAAFQLMRRVRGVLATEKVLSSFALIFIVIILSYRIYTPPASYDDLMYHLTYPVEWLKSGSLTMPPRPFGQPSHAYLPFNGELILFWLLLPCKSDFLAKFGQAPFVLLTIAAAFSISRKTGVRKRGALLCSLLALALPKFAVQGVFRAGNDIVFTFLFLASLNFLLMLRKNFSIPLIFCFSAAAGLLVGTKSLAVTYAPPLIIVFIYLAVRRRKLSAAAPLLLFLAIVLAVGGAGYLRNTLVMGNPLYPFELSAGTVKILDGPINPKNLHGTFLGNLNPLEDYPAILFILFSGGAVAFMLIRQRGRSAEKRAVMLMAGLAIYILIVFYRFIPFRNTRFLYPGMMLAAICLSWCASEIRAPGKIAACMRGLILVLLAYDAAAFFHDKNLSPMMLLSGILSLCIAVAGLGLVVCLLAAGRKYRCQGMKWKSIGLDLLTGAIITSLAGGLLGAGTAYEENKYRCNEWLYFPLRGDGEAWKWVDEHSGPGGVTIGYTGIENIYPFYGSWLRNDALPVLRGTPAEWQFGLPLDETGSIIYNNTMAGRYDKLNVLEEDRINSGIFDWEYRLWRGNLIGKGVEWVLVRGRYTTATRFSPEPRFLGYPIEDEWAKSNPADFKLIYSSSSYRIYEFLNNTTSDENNGSKDTLPGLQAGVRT